MNKWNKTSEIKPKSPKIPCLALYHLAWEREDYVPYSICFYDGKEWKIAGGRYMNPPDYWCEIEIPELPKEDD